MSNDQWRKENTKLYSLRVTIASGIPAAMEKACTDSEQTPSEYLREALLEKLDFEGYIHMEVAKQKKTRRKFSNLVEE